MLIAKNNNMDSQRVNTSLCRRRAWLPVIAAAVGGLICVPPAIWGAEFDLRSECHVRGAMIVLGDVAEVRAADPRQASSLAAIELFPVPPAGRQRFLRMREIQDLLVLRGIDIAEHHFSGASQVAILAEPEAAAPRGLAPALLKKAEHDASEAIARYLRQQSPRHEAWVVSVELDGEAARVVLGAAGRILVHGRTAGDRFTLVLDSQGRSQTLEVDARVALPPPVVVAARAISRGVLIQAEDLELQTGLAGDPSETFGAVPEVVGQETLRSIGKGRAITRDSLRSPLAVRRGELITVYARSAGIRIRTIGRAHDDGSVGDLVAVESLWDRKTYTARVCGIQEAEVFARPVEAERVAAGPIRVTNPSSSLERGN
jgi:flagella basal body P-ring formation protein FlgA